MPCPHCKTEIAYSNDVRQSPGRFFPMGAGLRYSVNQHGHVADAWYECDACSKVIDEKSKIAMLDRGRFEIKNPAGDPGHVGIWIWAAYSTDPQSGWKDIAKKHLRTIIDPSYLQTYVNQTLAEPFSVWPTANVDASDLEKRKVIFRLPDGTLCHAPGWAQFIVGGIDCQQGSLDDASKPPRLEMSVVAVGANRQWAVLAHYVIASREMVDPLTGEIETVPVEPFTTACCDAVWDILQKDWICEDGRALRIRTTFVDTSWRPEDADRFCKLPMSKSLGILPIKGASTERYGNRTSILPVNLTMAKAKKSGRTYFPIGTQTVKDTLGRILPIPAPGPESVIFAHDLPPTYFAGLLTEQLVELRPGVTKWERFKRDNTGEELDCLVYAYAAAKYVIRKSGKNSRLSKLVDLIDPAAAAEALSRQAEAIAAKKGKPEEVVAEDAKTEPMHVPTPLPAAVTEPGPALNAAHRTVQPAPGPPKPKYTIAARPSKRAPVRMIPEKADETSVSPSVQRALDRAARQGKRW